MVMQWGQFLDHDMDHSMEAISRQTFENGITCSATCENRPPCFPIQINNGRCMEFIIESTQIHPQIYNLKNLQFA